MITDDGTKGAGGENDRADKAGGGEETRVERVLNRWVGDAIHLVIARKIVTPDISALELALGVAAQCVLRVDRFYSPPGKMK